jgi:two-component SAPR family response regulator
LVQARHRLAPAELTQTQRRAAEILEGAGQFEEAIILYRLSEDWESMARIILANARVMIEQGRFRTLLEWIERLPKDFVEQNAHILFWKGVAVMSMSPAASRENLEHSFALFKKERDVAGMLFCFPAIVNAYIHEWNDLTGMGRWIEEMDELMQSSPAFPSQELEARVAVAMVSALSFSQLGNPRLEAWVNRLHSLMNVIEDPNLHCQAVIQLAFFYSFSGRLAEFEVEIDKLRHASSAISPFYRIASILPQIIHAWQVLASHEEGMRLIAEGLRIAESTGVHVLDCSLQIQGTYCALTTGNLKDAETLIAAVAPDAHDTRILNRSHYCYKTGWLAWLRGDLAAADALLREARSLTLRSGSPFYVALTLFGLVQVNISANEFKKAEAYLDEVQPIIRNMRSPIMEFIYLVLRTQTALAGIAEAGPGSPPAKRSDDFLPLLRQTLALGREQGYVNFPWWHSGIMAKLCVRALEHGIEVEYVQSLIRRRKLIPPIDEIEIENWPWPVRIYTLGRFAIVKDGKPLQFAEKAKHMPLKLLKVIIAFGGRDIGAEVVIDTLWPDAEGDAAYRAFVTNLQRLRRLIGRKDAVEHKDGRLTLNPRCVWVDVWTFERLLSKAEAIPLFTTSQNEAIRLIEKAVSIYHGRFLSREEQPWAASFSERLRARFLHNVERIGRYWENAGDWQKAQECYLNAINIDDLSEVFYQRLMMAYQRLGRTSDAIAVYQRCCKVLSSAMGIPPSPATEEIYNSIQKR